MRDSRCSLSLNVLRPFTVATPDGPVAIQGLPQGFRSLFFPTDEAVPWWSGDFTTDPNGAVKRAQAKRLAEVGLTQSVTGGLASLAVLVRSLTLLLFRLSSLLLFALFATVAAAGLFGSNSIWVGAIGLAWLALYPLRIGVSVATIAIASRGRMT